MGMAVVRVLVHVMRFLDMCVAVVGRVLLMMTLVRQVEPRLRDQPGFVGLLNACAGARDVCNRGDVVPVDAVTKAESGRRGVDANTAAQAAGKDEN